MGLSSRLLQKAACTHGKKPLIPAPKVHADAEKAMRAAIKSAPNGTYKAAYRGDGDGRKEPVIFKCAITIKEDEIFARDYLKINE